MPGDREDHREDHDQQQRRRDQPGDQRGRARRHRVVEHVAEPVAEPGLLLRRGLDRRADRSSRHRLRRADPQLLSRACHVVPLRAGPEWPEIGPDDPPSPTTGRHWHDRAMQSSPEAADRLARRAAALAFATQGLVFISLTTRLPRFSDRWDLSEVELSLVLLMIVLLAGAGSVVAERSAHRSDSACTLRAGLLIDRGRGPGASPRRRPAAVFVAGARGVRRRAGHRRRDQQHAGGRGRAPLRPPDPAVVPRRLDLRRHHRRRYALAAAHAPLWTAGLVAVVPLVAIAAPYLRREHGEAARRGRAGRRARGGRSCWSGSGWCSSTWSTPPRRPGDRPSSTTSSTHRSRWWRSRRCPTSSPAWSCGSPATRLVARYGAVLVLRIGAVVGLAGAARGGHLADLAGRGPRLHAARRRRRR